MKRLLVLLACLLAVPAQGQILSIIAYGTNQPASTPTFSPAAGAVSNPTTVTASTSTSDGCTIYFDTSNPPVTVQTTYSVTTGVTLYAQARGCVHHRDSLVGSAAYTIASGGLALVTGTTHTCSVYKSSGGALSCAITGVNSGDGLVLFCGADNTYTMSFTDSAGTPATAKTYSGVGATAISIVTSAASGSHTIQCSGGAFYSFLYAQEYSGVALSSALGASQSSHNNFSPVTCSAITTTQANSMTVGLLTNSAQAWGSLTSSFVQRASQLGSSTGWSMIDNVATLNGSSGSSISTTQAYSPTGGSWDCLLVEVTHQ